MTSRWVMEGRAWYMTQVLSFYQSFLWGHWYPCFGLLVTSPPGFKAKVGSVIHTWWRCMHCTISEIYLWCNTCWPLGGQHGSWTDLFDIPASRYWWGSNLNMLTDKLFLYICQPSSCLPCFIINSFLSSTNEGPCLVPCTICDGSRKRPR